MGKEISIEFYEGHYVINPSLVTKISVAATKDRADGNSQVCMLVIKTRL